MKNRLIKKFATLICVVLLVGCGGEEAAWKPVETPFFAPDFAVKDLETRQPVWLHDLKGKVVVMEFWATWCGPCRQTVPSLDVIHRQYEDRGVHVLLINQAEDPDIIRKWADGRIDAQIAMDPFNAVAKQYGVTGLPRLFIIDQDGMIRYAKSGYRGGLERQLSLILDQLLSEQES